MDHDRRELCRQLCKHAGLLGILAALGLIGEQAFAQAAGWNKAAFESKNLQDVLKALGGSTVTESKDVTVTGPEIAENGAVVPVGVLSRIPDTTAVHILVEKNPNSLAASFTIPPGTEPNVSTRIKMGQSSNVTALVLAGGRWYSASKEVKVTLGGCGG